MIFWCNVSSSDQEIGTYRIISWKNSTYHLNLGRLHNVIDKAELYFLWILFGGILVAYEGSCGILKFFKGLGSGFRLKNLCGFVSAREVNFYD